MASTLRMHLVYTGGFSRTVCEPVNPRCLVLGVHGCGPARVAIRYVRTDGAITFAEYRAPPGPAGAALSHAFIVPAALHRALRSLPLRRAAADRVLAFAGG